MKNVLKIMAVMFAFLSFTCTVFAIDLPDTPKYKVFPGIKTVGKLPQNEFMMYVNDIKDTNNQKSFSWFRKNPRPWQITDHQIGYLPFRSYSGSSSFAISPARSIHPNFSMYSSSIDVRIDKIRVYDYPGSSTHSIMFTFNATNTISDGKEESVAFTQQYNAAETQGVGILGYPVFRNLNVGKMGTGLKLTTINISNSQDEKALKVLESRETQAGLALLTTAQPAIAPFTELAMGFGKMALSKNKNKAVEEIYLGLDFDEGSAYGARIAEGNYIVVQALDSKWNWNDWVFDPNRVCIVNKQTRELPPYNYIIFRISKHKK